MGKKIIRSFTVCVLIVLLAGASHAQEESLRVAILNDRDSFSLTIKGEFTVQDVKSQQVLWSKRRLRKATVAANAEGIFIGSQYFPVDRLMVRPERDGRITIDKRRFRGTIVVIKEKDNRLTVVNTVELESYVKGVLYHEISDRWPLEAIKAQAVAVRTYALYRKNLYRNKDYELTSDIYSQVYGGRSAERYRTNLGVKKTRGLVLTYRGKIFPAYFHATCGGFTEDVDNLWGGGMEPLKGKVCPFCEHSPHYFWKRNYRLKNIQDTLNANGYQLGLIKEIRVAERNKSGRIVKLEIITRDEKSASISGKDFRGLIGPNTIKSNNYTVDMKGYYMDLLGKGWGHGVGLCQWGALGMARKHYGFDEILKFYYPGAEVAPHKK